MGKGNPNFKLEGAGFEFSVSGYFGNQEKGILLGEVTTGSISVGNTVTLRSTIAKGELIKTVKEIQIKTNVPVDTATEGQNIGISLRDCTLNELKKFDSEEED